MVRLWIPLPIAIASVVGAVAVAAVLAGPNVTGPAVVLVFFLLAPGFALVRLVELRDPPLEAVLSVAISLALAGLVATAQAYFGAWSPSATVVILIAITAGALVIHPVRAMVPRFLSSAAHWGGAAVTIARPVGKATAAKAATALAMAGRTRMRAAGRLSLLWAQRRSSRAAVGTAVATPAEVAVITRRLANIPVASTASVRTGVRMSRAKSTDASQTTAAPGSPRGKGARSASPPRPGRGSKGSAPRTETMRPEATPAPKKAAQRRSSATGTANLTGPAAASGPTPRVERGARKVAAASPAIAEVHRSVKKATVAGKPTAAPTASPKTSRKRSTLATIAPAPKPARPATSTGSRPIEPVEPVESKRQTRKAAAVRTAEEPSREARRGDRNRNGEVDGPARPAAIELRPPPMPVSQPRSSRGDERGDIPPPPVAVIRRRPHAAEQQPRSRRRTLGEIPRFAPRAAASVRSAIEQVVDDLADLRDRGGKP